MARYFDAHGYFAAWGSPRLMLRLPKAQVNLHALKPYFAGRTRPGLTATTNHVVLDFDTAGDERESGCDERVTLKTLAKVRDKLAQRDLRCAYLGWLIGLENGEPRDGARELSLQRDSPSGRRRRTR